MSSHSGGNTNGKQANPVGSPAESPRRLKEAPPIATANRFELLEAMGTTNVGAATSVLPIRSAQTPTSSGSESQPARRQTQDSSEGSHPQPEQKPVISRVSTYRGSSLRLVDSTSEPSNGRKTMDGTAMKQSEEQTRKGQSHSSHQAQSQGDHATARAKTLSPAEMQAWKAAGCPNCESCGKRHPPPCDTEIAAESQRRAQKKIQRKEQNRQHAAQEQAHRDLHRRTGGLRLVNRAALSQTRVSDTPQRLEQWPPLVSAGHSSPPAFQGLSQQESMVLSKMPHSIPQEFRELLPTFFHSMSEDTKYKVFMSMYFGEPMSTPTSSEGSEIQTDTTEDTSHTTNDPPLRTSDAGTKGKGAVLSGAEKAPTAHNSDGQRPSENMMGKRPRR
ncbi:hypothetical protein Q7P37_006500 [Cladosporium fusiforme]